MERHLTPSMGESLKLLSGEKSIDFLKEIIYSDTQVAEEGVDLTVDKIYKIEEKGEIDFGGGERKDAELSEIKPALRNEDDDYGWWDLDSGTYLLEYNEELEDEKNCIIQPLERLYRNSTTHPTIASKKITKIPINVGKPGISIKENSRVSKLVILED